MIPTGVVSQRAAAPGRPWHCLYFLPLPHGHGALRGILSETAWLTTTPSLSGGG